MLDVNILLEQSAARTTSLLNDFGQIGIPKEVLLILCAEEILRESFWLAAGGSAEELERRNPRLFRNKVSVHYGEELDDLLRPYYDATFSPLPEDEFVVPVDLSESTASSIADAYRAEDHDQLAR